MRIVKLVASLLFGLVLCHAVGTAWHEVVGHGLTGVACGGRIERVEVLTVQWYPRVEFVGWDGAYGRCRVEGIQTGRGRRLMSLGGSMSTWLVSVGAVCLLWARRWRGRPRVVLAFLGLWWIDLLTYTLPSWGLRRSILWGRVYSEPYEAAVALGVPGPVFQALVVTSSLALAAGLALGLRRTCAARRSAPDVDRSDDDPMERRVSE